MTNDGPRWVHKYRNTQEIQREKLWRITGVERHRSRGQGTKARDAIGRRGQQRKTNILKLRMMYN